MKYVRSQRTAMIVQQNITDLKDIDVNVGDSKRGSVDPQADERPSKAEAGHGHQHVDVEVDSGA